ncbi:MAG: peptidoglycan editing factor PgeF [Bdellovibrionia bacterium]
MMTLQSELLLSIPNIQHGFGSAFEPVPSDFIEVWKKSSPVHRQVHGTAWAYVQSPGQACGEVDTLFTDQAGLPVGVMTADCVPILLAQSSGEWVASVHAGWRGTMKHSLVKLWEEFDQRGHNPKDWVAAIGPAIGPCCYQVSSALVKEFKKEFLYLDPHGEWIEPRPDRLDLQAIHEAELKQIGLQRVQRLRYCTFCSRDPQFHSYRRNAAGAGRQWSMIKRALSRTAPGRSKDS